jgi:membrane-associated phospholipid phosphatase
LPRNVKAPLAACLACVGGFVLLAALAYWFGPVQRFDAAALARLIEPGARTGSVTEGVARLGDLAALVLMLTLVCAVALARRRPRRAVASVALVAGANLTTQLFKALLAHPRFQSIVGAEQLASNSFPSGHVTAMASIAIAAVFVVPRDLRLVTAALGACLVAAVGCAVMALAWHYPSDVLGGILVAAAWGFAALAALRLGEGGASRRAAPQLGRRAAISLK